MGDDPAIDVVAATSEHLQAFLAGPEAIIGRFGLDLEEGLDMFPGALATSLRELEDGADPQWHTHLFVDVDRGRVVGFGGFKGPPEAGAVEVGYAVASAARGRGVATAAVRLLVDRARQQGAVVCLAHTLPESSSSTAVLERCGFTMVGEGIDPEVGSVWQWRLTLPESPDRLAPAPEKRGSDAFDDTGRCSWPAWRPPFPQPDPSPVVRSS